MSVTIKLRRNTAAGWVSGNPTLSIGEPGYEKDTGLFKIGDGETPWNDLPYSSGHWGDINGATTNQIMMWDGSLWNPVTLVVDGGNISPLLDTNETASGVFNTQISGNLLTNVTLPEAGLTVTVSQVTINSVIRPLGEINIADVGVFNITSNGDWTFTPETDYEGPVPVVNYVVLCSDGKTNSSTLTISDITAEDFTSGSFTFGGADPESSEPNFVF